MTDQPTDMQILDLARRFEMAQRTRPGARDRAAMDELRLSSTAFARRLLDIVSAPSVEVAEAHAQLIGRLRRQLERATQRRSARRAA
ncbi:MAG: DUF3263 domain-containing protein [Jatrophihabitans sp.]|uniref:DUF3263 domain-containing protein n=1 Tax=Jatrophihabitans sp. TaxID=1932789 RepID=UPI003F80BB35